MVEEVNNNFGQWNEIVELNAFWREILEFHHVATTRLTQLHESSCVFLWSNDGNLKEWFFNKADVLHWRQISWVRNINNDTICARHAVCNRWSCSNESQIELTLEALFHNLHVQQTKEPTSESKSKSA